MSKESKCVHFDRRANVYVDASRCSGKLVLRPVDLDIWVTPCLTRA